MDGMPWGDYLDMTLSERFETFASLNDILGDQKGPDLNRPKNWRKAF